MIGFADNILDEYNLARSNPKYYANKIKTFREKLELDITATNQDVYFFKNSCGTKIVLRNALNLTKEVIDFLNDIKPLKPLKSNLDLSLSAKKCLENVKPNKNDRIDEIKDYFSLKEKSLKITNKIESKDIKEEDDEDDEEKEDDEESETSKENKESKIFESIIGFGDYDPSLIVTLQIIDHKDNNYPRSCIFNEKLEYCGVSVVESEKLKIVIMSNFSNKP